MRINLKFVLLIIITVFLLPFRFFAQSENHNSNLEEGNHFHYNHIAMFIGASSLFERDATYFTLGADYIRYFSPESDFAAGVFSEAIFNQDIKLLVRRGSNINATQKIYEAVSTSTDYKQETT